jgi:arginyl-tRNA synthetase
MSVPLPVCVTMSLDEILEHIKRRRAELAAIKKKESRKRKNQKYWEKIKSSIAQSSVQYKRSKKNSIAAINVHWKQHYQNNKESISQ